MRFFKMDAKFTKALLVNIVLPLVAVGIYNRYSMTPVCVPAWIPVDLPCGLWGLMFWSVFVALALDLIVYGIYPKITATKKKQKILISIDPIEFEELPPRLLDNGILWVGIEIFNTSMYEVHCAMNVKTKAMAKDGVMYYQNFNQPNSQTSFDILRKSSLPFYIACAAKEGFPNAVLNTVVEAGRRIYTGSHELTLTVIGEDSEKNLIEHSENFILTYRGEDKLKLRKR